MKKLILLAALCLPSTGFAECIGTSGFSTCYDDQGNSYSVNRLGNSTYIDGYNSRTGSRWSQESMTLGNTTYHNGRAANGQSWNMTETQNSFGSTYSGRNSSGRSFFTTCDRFGNCY